jgi:hypothetical protein
MRILVLSDTHLESGNIPELIFETIKNYDMVIHAGDFTSPECYRAFENTGKLKAVHGNSDSGEIKKLLPETLRIEADGVRIGVIHEGALSINDTTALRYKALEMGVDILIFGHIHHPVYEKNDVTLLCPGSPTKPRMSDPMMAELIIEKGITEVNFVEVEGNSCGYVDYSRRLADGM